MDDKMNFLRLFFKEDQIVNNVQEYLNKVKNAKPGDILLLDDSSNPTEKNDPEKL
jgi:hypothetical protein